MGDQKRHLKSINGKQNENEKSNTESAPQGNSKGVKFTGVQRVQGRQYFQFMNFSKIINKYNSDSNRDNNVPGLI